MIKKTIFLILLFASVVNAQTNDIADVIRKRNKAEVEKIYLQEQIKEENNHDILVLPGLIADRKARILHLFAEATGLAAGETAEFFLIAEKSGHDYEALAVSFATPGDIRKALIFIGMTPGLPADYSRWRFWSKGERIMMQFKSVNGKGDLPYIVAEDLVENKLNGKTLPVDGFIFTGSREVTSKINSAIQDIAADVFEPMSIAANYNEIDSIFDVPRIARQGEVYTTQVVSKKYHFKPGELLDVIIKPERAVDNPRVYSLHLDISVDTNSDANIKYKLSDDNSVIIQKTIFADILKKCRKYIQQAKDPYMTISFADNMPVSALQKSCVLLAAVDAVNGIRIDEPPAGQLYYKSFVPEERLRKRENRVPLKWEFYINNIDGKLQYKLINLEPEWKNDSDNPEFKTVEYNIKDSVELMKILNSKEMGIPVMLVFAQPNITYGQLRQMLQPVMKKYNVVHIFMQK